MLIAAEEPSYEHQKVFDLKTRVFVKALLKAFWPNARGSLCHACWALRYLLRHYPDEVRQG